MYWENKNDSCPEYINLCIKSVYKKCENDFDIRLLNQQTIYKFVDLHKNFKEIKTIAHKADYLRYKLLYEYGGIWIDSDMIVLKNLRSISNKLNSHNHVLIKSYNNIMSINFMVAKPKNKIFKECIQVVEKKLNYKTKFKWSEIGSNLITSICRKNNNVLYLNPYKISPLRWNECHILGKPINQIEKDKLNSIMDSNFVAISNKAQHKKKQNIIGMNQKQLLESDMLISFLFRKALFD